MLVRSLSLQVADFEIVNLFSLCYYLFSKNFYLVLQILDVPNVVSVPI